MTSTKALKINLGLLTLRLAIGLGLFLRHGQAKLTDAWAALRGPGASKSHYPYRATRSGWMPSPNVKSAPTAPTTAVSRVSPMRLRKRYRLSIPVQCAPIR